MGSSTFQSFPVIRTNPSIIDSGNILKPSLDLVLFTSQLARSLGVRGTILLFANYYATVSILRAVTPAFGRLAAVEARLEGEYRAGMGRVGREAEEVALVFLSTTPSQVADDLSVGFIMEVSWSGIYSRDHI